MTKFRNTKNCGFYSTSLRCAIFAVVLIFSGGVQADLFPITEDDMPFLPVFCRAKLLQSKQPDIQKHWAKTYGTENWMHLHHQCYGAKALNLAYRDFKDVAKRTYFAKLASNEFNYVLNATEPDFVLRREVLTQRGRALTLAKQYGEAEKNFSEALKIEPKSVDTWVALSDLYRQTDRIADAIKTLEKAIEVTGGEHRKITVRLDDLKKLQH